VAGGTTLAGSAHVPLPEAFDAAGTVPPVQALLDGFGTRGGAIRDASVIDGKPGERLLLRYDVEGPSPGPTLFGKVFADPTAAVRVHETMCHLWEAFAGCGDPTTVPQPLGLLPDLNLVVYAPAPGVPLDEMLHAPEAAAALRLAGSWLGHLHAAAVPLDRRFVVATELLNAADWGGVVAAVAPDVAAAAVELCRQLRQQADRVTLDEATPIHKDFHPGHVIVDGSVAVVDFDEARLGDAAFDVAHFCAYLHLAVLRQCLGERQEALESAFLDGYSARSGWTPDERFALFRAYTAVKIAKQLATTRGPRPRPCGDELAHQLHEVLAEGTRWVEAGT
jgi:Phosphotransferase enzyme family